ncbi:MAG: pyruvate kinase [Patescibacteria group bacterium]|mgnify:FL=1
MYLKRTKIVCTLGPSSDSVSEILKLVQSGMNVARLNFSHGSYDHHAKLIKNIHEVEKLTEKRIGIIQDLQGPKIRLGTLPQEGLTVKKTDTFILTSQKITGKQNNKTIIIPIQLKNFTKTLKKSGSVLINDGLIEAKILEVGKDKIKCRIISGGLIKSHAGVSFPGSAINIPPITEKDKKDLKFGLQQNVDYVALSFVKSAEDIKNLRKLIRKSSKDTKIIAKIERHAAVINLKEIIKESDGIMVARGDLGMDIPPEQVPIVQKRIIRLSNKFAKPVITATEVLLSMVVSPRATRAEISDAANAVFDHTDAIMLSNESAVGKFPSRAARTLSKVSETVEQELQKYEELLPIIQNKQISGNENLDCLNACELAMNTKANFLVVYTSDGSSAREIAKYRTYTPIIVITETEKTARELTLVWGLNKIFTSKIGKNEKEKINKIVALLKQKKEVKKGQKLVIICSASSKEKLISNITI